MMGNSRLTDTNPEKIIMVFLLCNMRGYVFYNRMKILCPNGWIDDDRCETSMEDSPYYTFQTFHPEKLINLLVGIFILK